MQGVNPCLPHLTIKGKTMKVTKEQLQKTHGIHIPKDTKEEVFDRVFKKLESLGGKRGDDFGMFEDLNTYARTHYGISISSDDEEIYHVSSGRRSNWISIEDFIGEEFETVFDALKWMYKNPMREIEYQDDISNFKARYNKEEGVFQFFSNSLSDSWHEDDLEDILQWENIKIVKESKAENIISKLTKKALEIFKEEDIDIDLEVVERVIKKLKEEI